MKSFFYFTAAAIFLAGCSSSENVKTNVKTAETNAVVNQRTAPPVNQSDSANANNANVQNVENANEVVLEGFPISRGSVRNRGDKNFNNQSSQPIAEKIDKSVTSAPDNSEVSSSMNSKGQPTETRVFKNHPRLGKIERIDLNDSDIKVYLKNGKILLLPEDKAGNFLTATAAEIMEAVGVK